MQLLLWRLLHPAEQAEVLTLLCPSRGRPRAAAELLWSFNDTFKAEAELIFCLDNNDPSLGDYAAQVPDIVVGHPTGDPTGPLNAAALASTSDIIGFIGDDSRLETPGWDLMVESALRGPGFSWGYDPNQWPSTVFVSRSIVQTLGYLALPTLKRGYFDEVWTLLAEGADCFRPVNAMFRHDNSAGDPKSPNFKPQAWVPPKVIAADKRAFNEWRSGQMASDIRKLRHLIYS